MPIKTITIGSTKFSTRCKCGNYPTVGGQFWYTSKYDGSVIEGTIEKIDGGGIFSTNGVHYHCSDVEVVRVDIVREQKLNKLGIKDE